MMENPSKAESNSSKVCIILTNWHLNWLTILINSGKIKSEIKSNIPSKIQFNQGVFHLYLSELAFISKFYSIKASSAVISKWLVQKSFHNQFKIFWYGVLPKMRGIF